MSESFSQGLLTQTDESPCGESQTHEHSMGIEPSDQPSNTQNADANEGFEHDLTFGSFWIGETEFALPSSDVQEVVPFPSYRVPVPCSPEYVRGLFDLRGDIIPVVCVATLLGLPRAEDDSMARVAIVDCGSERIGAVFDRTGEVLRLESEQHRAISRARTDPDAKTFVSALLRLEGGQRLIQVLTAASLSEAEFIPRSQRLSNTHVIEEVPRQRMLICRVNEIDVAIEASDVIEIQEGLPIQPTENYFSHYEGVVDVRGELIPVLSLGEALGGAKATDPQTQRLVFVQDGRSVSALAVDEVLDWVEVTERELQAVPMLGRLPAGTFCDHVLACGSAQHALVVDVPAFFEHVGLVNGIPENPGSLARLQPDGDSELQHQEAESLLEFGLGPNRFAVEIEFVREIIEFPDSFIPTPGETETNLVGMVTIRGQVITLLDLRRRCGLESSVPVQATTILIAEHGNVGYLVDELHGIVHVASGETFDPSIRVSEGERSQSFRDLVHRVAQADGRAVVILDPEKLKRWN